MELYVQLIFSPLNTTPRSVSSHRPCLRRCILTVAKCSRHRPLSSPDGNLKVFWGPEPSFDWMVENRQMILRLRSFGRLSPIALVLSSGPFDAYLRCSNQRFKSLTGPFPVGPMATKPSGRKNYWVCCMSRSSWVISGGTGVCVVKITI